MREADALQRSSVRSTLSHRWAIAGLRRYSTVHNELYEPPDDYITSLRSSGVLHASSDAELMDITPVARPIARLMWQYHKAGAAEEAVSDVAALSETAPLIALRPRPASGGISDESLAALHIGAGAVTAMRYLNMMGMSIVKIDNLGGMTQLRTLVLSFNEIVKIDGLASLSVLETLHLGFNRIRRIENVKGLSSLKALQLNNNDIHKAEDLSVLRKYVPNLTELSLASNPITGVKYYRRLVLRRLKRLALFDGRAVTEHERELALDNMSTVTTEMIHAAALCFRHLSTAPKLPLALTAEAGSDAAVDGTEEAEGVHWWKNVEELDISRRHLRRISNLNRLVNLRRLNISENEIVRIEGLEQCVRLEDLSLEDNRLARIENITQLGFLKKLDLGKNRITQLDGLQHLVHLMQVVACLCTAHSAVRCAWRVFIRADAQLLRWPLWTVRCST